MKNLFLIFVPVFLIIFSLSSCIFGEGGIEKAGKIIQINRTLDHFTGISVNSGIEVEIKMGTTEGVLVEAGERIIPQVITEVRGGILHIERKHRGFAFQNNQNNIKVYVNARELSSIEGSSGSSIHSLNLISSQNIEIQANSGSSIRINVKALNIQAEASSGSDLDLSGNSDKIHLEASSGSSLRAGDLNTQFAEVKSSSGSDIHVLVTKILNGEASSGGSIHYRGNPSQVSKEASSGGSIETE